MLATLRGHARNAGSADTVPESITGEYVTPARPQGALTARGSILQETKIAGSLQLTRRNDYYKFSNTTVEYHEVESRHGAPWYLWHRFFLIR